MTMLQHALRWWELGYTPLPLAPDGTKRPAVRKWADLQQRRPTRDELEHMFQVDHDGLGIITGAVSGNFELLELEARAIQDGLFADLTQAFADNGLAALWATITAGYMEATPSGGLHIYYRVDGAARPNTKLARRPSTPDELDAWKQAELTKADQIAEQQLRDTRIQRINDTQPDGVLQVLIETRGEGGFTVVAPSGGRSHPTGLPWTAITGTPATIPTISADDRDALYTICGLLDQTPEHPADPRPAAPLHGATPTTPGSLRPGDDYNLKTSWEDILIPDGWTICARRGQEIDWTRPGKHPRDGMSATTGRRDGHQDCLYVFSSSVDLPTDEPVTKFYYHALTKYSGDLKAAAAGLAKEGYGEPAEPQGQALTLIRGGNHQDNDRPPMDGTAALQPDDEQPEPVTPIVLARYGATEDGLARALAIQCADTIRHCPQRGMWLCWTGARWEWDEAGAHRELIKQLARQLPDNKVWETHRKRMLSNRGIDGVAGMARTDPAVVVHIDDLDSHPWQLNTPAGAIDLTTGQLTPPDPAALHTRSTTVTPDYQTPAPNWQRFLADTFGGDQELTGFVQRALGVSVAGIVIEQFLPFAFGPGANGKSTLMNVVMKILGRGRDGYAIALDSEALMVRRFSEHPAELAQLAGARMVVSSEIEDGQKFAEARLKQLTGGDPISARFMRSNPFTFIPTHTLWLVGNHRPNANAGGDALWRRIKLIPFSHIVPEESRDPRLECKLMGEASQILAWLAQGAADYHANGLRPPAAVVEATGTYRADQDSVGKFIAERCMLTSAGHVKVSELRAAYEGFCKETGDNCVGTKQLAEQLRDQHGITLAKSGSHRIYRGITLYADDEEPAFDDWRDR